MWAIRNLGFCGYCCFIVSTKSMQTAEIENTIGAKLWSAVKCQVSFILKTKSSQHISSSAHMPDDILTCMM